MDQERRCTCVADYAVTAPHTLPSTPVDCTPVLLCILNPLDKNQRKTSTGSFGCSVEFEHSVSVDSTFSEASLQSSSSFSSSSKGYTSQQSMGSINENTDSALSSYSSKGYSSQPSMGSIDENTDSAVASYRRGMPRSRVACDSPASAELDFTNKGGSLVEFLENGDLALAPSSGQQDPPLYKLLRYRGYDIDDGKSTGEVILLRSQQYCTRYLTGHTTDPPGPAQWTVDARASFTQDPEWPTVDSYWRPVGYEKAFQGTPFYDPSLAGKGYFILQHWPYPKDNCPPNALDLKAGHYFVIKPIDHQWNYLVSTWNSSFTHGLFVFQ